VEQYDMVLFPVPLRIFLSAYSRHNHDKVETNHHPQRAWKREATEDYTM